MADISCHDFRFAVVLMTSPHSLNGIVDKIDRVISLSSRWPLNFVPVITSFDVYLGVYFKGGGSGLYIVSESYDQRYAWGYDFKRENTSGQVSMPLPYLGF